MSSFRWSERPGGHRRSQHPDPVVPEYMEKLGAGKGATVRVTSSSNFAKRCVFRCSWV